MIFADDTTLSTMILLCLLWYYSCAENWKITFNASKSKDMIFSKKYLNNSTPLQFDGLFIDSVNTHKHIAIQFTVLWFNSKLNVFGWSETKSK